MAGRPAMKALEDRIAKAADALGQSAEEYVLGMVIDGARVTQIAKEFDTSRSMMYEWLTRKPERNEAWQKARLLVAHGIVEDAQDVADGMTSDSVTVDREKLRFLTWLAERFNRAAYGQQQGGQVNVQVSLTLAHLQAARMSDAELRDLVGDEQQQVGVGGGAAEVVRPEVSQRLQAPAEDGAQAREDADSPGSSTGEQESGV